MSRSHTAIQKAIIKSLPKGELEYRFQEIGRIADVVYFPQKIIYEVQCSLISLQEVQTRNRDYASLGFTIIWILHDHHFNKKNLSLAELYLRQSLSYYTSITPYGQGFFYDQLEFFHGTTRLYKSKPYLLKNLLPRPRRKPPLFFPKILKEKPPYILSGDVTDTLIKEKKGKKMYQFEKSFSYIPFAKKWITPFFHYFLRKNSSSHKF